MKTKNQVCSHSGTKVSRSFCKKIMSTSEKNNESDWFLESDKIENYSRKLLVGILLAVLKIIPLYFVQKFLLPKDSLSFL